MPCEELDAAVDLSFPVQDVNDMLKSLVLQDMGGGQISAVSFDSQAPIEKTLRSFAVDLSANPTLASILDQARGEKIEVVLQQPRFGEHGPNAQLAVPRMLPSSETKPPTYRFMDMVRMRGFTTPLTVMVE